MKVVQYKDNMKRGNSIKKLTEEHFMKISKKATDMAHDAIQDIKSKSNLYSDFDISLYNAMATIAVSCALATYDCIAETCEE